MAGLPDNNVRFYNGLAARLQSDQAMQDDRDGTLYYANTLEDGRHFRLGDYNSSLSLIDATPIDREARRQSLAAGTAWLTLQEADSPELGTRNVQVIGPSYEIVDPGLINPQSVHGGAAVLNGMRASLGYEPAGGRPLVYVVRDRLVVPDLLENDFLRGVFAHVTQ